MIEAMVSIFEGDDNWVALNDLAGERTSDKWGDIKVDYDILNEALDLVLKAYKGGK